MDTLTQSKKNIMKASDCVTFGDLFTLVMNKTKLDTKVATLAFFDKIVTDYSNESGYGIASVKPFPLIDSQHEYNLDVYFFFDNNKQRLILEKNGNKISTDIKSTENYLSKNEIVLVIFSDYNFKNNLLTNEPVKTIDTDMHNQAFGILIKLNNQSYIDYVIKESDK